MNDTELIDVLAGTLARTGELIAATGTDRWSEPTPCPAFDVHALVGHIVGWIEVFAAGAVDRPYEGDPGAVVVDADSAARFRAAAGELVAGWRTHGLEREVRTFSGGMMPGRMIFGMTLMEYLAHGWDLARSTGQPVTFSDAAATEALATAHAVLLPEYRGPEAFGAIVEVPDDATALDRFLGFMGRDPRWTSPSA